MYRRCIILPKVAYEPLLHVRASRHKTALFDLTIMIIIILIVIYSGSQNH